MAPRSLSRTAIVAAVLLVAATLTTGTASAGGRSAHPTPTGSGHALSPGTRLYTPQPDPGAVRQIVDLTKHRKIFDALRLGAMVTTPQAVWLTKGTPAEVEKSVRRTVQLAALTRTVPVFVAYDLPFRDCGQYSAGGAADTASYLAWIDGVARGIGTSTAVVLLEPDGLGVIPYNIDINGAQEWCRPDLTGTGLTGAGANEARYAQLNGAVDRLESQPNVSVYLDATHSGWLGAGDAASRLAKAGVQRAQGFFVNVSNYQATPQLTKYGTWISGCLAFAANADDGGWRLGHYNYCGSQYYPATQNDFSTWQLTDQWYANNLGNAVATTHFVIDTSRNGQGPTDMSAYGAAPFNQSAATVSTLQNGNWCNAPGAGLGLRPTTRTNVPLLDAYLWVKTPGQSDGQCDAAGAVRAWDFAAYTQPGWPTTAAAQSQFDPLWGMVDPAAGDWFPAQALALAHNADPALR
jgi:endoglucanase